MKLKIISAKNLIYDGDDVKAVSVPGQIGQMQILPGHANLVSSLKIGEVKVKSTDGQENFVLNGGFVVIRDDNMLILADDIEKESEIKIEEIEQAIESAQQRKADSENPAELIQLEKKLRYERFKKQRTTN